MCLPTFNLLFLLNSSLSFVAIFEFNCSYLVIEMTACAFEFNLISMLVDTIADVVVVAVAIAEPDAVDSAVGVAITIDLKQLSIA